jgi:hypothetical protein
VAEVVVGGVHDFDDLVRRLPGVYPADVAASIYRLLWGGSIPRSLAYRLLPRSDSCRPTILPRLYLPIPHPLDYDWRFTGSTSELLWQHATNIGRLDEPVVCLGTPSVYREAVRRQELRRAVLLDANSAIVTHFMRHGRLLRVFRCDLLTDGIPSIRSSVIVADPPWYEDHMTAFLWAAAQICVAGGHVLMSLPPKGTRPGVEEEVRRVLDRARCLGFEVVATDEGALHYESPPFERNALLAAGIRLASPDWRRGDLYVLQLRTAMTQERPRTREGSCQWVNVTLLGMRVQLRPKRASHFVSPTLLPLVQENILPSVSRRHPLRGSVDVWTSGNRVFRCAGTHVLHRIIRGLARGQEPSVGVASALRRDLSRSEKELACKAAQQVLEIAECERSDFCFAGFG